LTVAIRHISRERSPACLLDPGGSFLFVNDAWDHHALENGGGPSCLGASLIGTRWLDHIRGEEVRRRHEELLARALRARPPRPRRVTHVAESNTPTRAALISTRLEPVLVPCGEVVAVAIVHGVVRDRPIEEVYDLVDRPLDAYRDASGEVTQCSCCRRMRDPAEPERWDLLPALLASPQPVSHGLCELCAELHDPAKSCGVIAIR
jgi:hypothetical protein